MPTDHRQCGHPPPPPKRQPHEGAWGRSCATLRTAVPCTWGGGGAEGRGATPKWKPKRRYLRNIRRTKPLLEQWGVPPAPYLRTVQWISQETGVLGYYLSPTHPLPDAVLQNPIRIVDLDMPHGREQLHDSLGKEHLDELWQLVLTAWDSLRVDDMLASTGNMSMEVCPKRQ